MPAQRAGPTAGLAPRDQVGESCVGEAVTTSLRALLKLPPLSALFAYYNARRLYTTVPVDEGTHIRAVCKAAKRFGCCPEERWRTTEENVSEQPTWSAYHAASDLRPSFAYKFLPLGQPEAIREAIALGHPVVAGWFLDASFKQNAGPEVIEPPKGPTVGGHCMVLEAYHADGTFTLLNSWGTDWRQQGRARVSEEFVRLAIDPVLLSVAA